MGTPTTFDDDQFDAITRTCRIVARVVTAPEVRRAISYAPPSVRATMRELTEVQNRAASLAAIILAGISKEDSDEFHQRPVETVTLSRKHVEPTIESLRRALATVVPKRSTPR